MTVSVDPDELPTMATALAHHAETVRSVSSDVHSCATTLHDRAAAVVRVLAADLAAAEQALAALPPDTPPDVVAARRRRLDQARDQLAHGQAAQRKLTVTLDDLDRVVRSRSMAVEKLADQGTSRLMRFWETLGRTLAAFRARLAALNRTTVSGPQQDVMAHSATSAPSFREAGSAGHVLVDISAIDASDRQIRDTDFTKVSAADMRRGLLRLEQTILPAVLGGAGIDRMRQLDESAGLTNDPASHVAVYEAFFGSTAIRLSRDSAGRITVENGYHRIQLARQLGVEQLPALIRNAR